MKMLLKQKVNFKVLLLAILAISLLTGISFLMAFADDGDTGIGLHTFEVFRFPTHTLFWEYFSSTSSLYRVGLFINIIFYSVIIERIITLFRRSKKNKL